MAALQLFTNNATSTLASGISAGATALSVPTGEGSRFPAPATDQSFFATLISVASGNYEIVKVTARTGDAFTIVRAQDGTAAQAFVTGDRVELRVTKGVLEAFSQKDADETQNGNKTFGGNVAVSGTTTVQAPTAAGHATRKDYVDTQLATKLTDPMTTVGDIMRRSALNQTERLPIGSTAQVLQVSGGLPVWALVTESNIAASSVSQGKLKTAQATTTLSGLSVNVPGGGSPYVHVFTPTGGEWMLGWQKRLYSAGFPVQASFTLYPDEGSVSAADTGFVTRAKIEVTLASTSEIIEMRHRYMQASPPNNFGDGDIPLLVYGLVAPSGRAHVIVVTEDTPWYYNGPNKIDPQTVFEDGGKKFRAVRQIIAEHGSLASARRRGLRPAVLADRMMTDPFVAEEITFAVKNRDMAVIPHPFVNVPAGHTVVLLDPVSDLCAKLCELHRGGYEESPAMYFARGDLEFDNVPLPRAVPPGVIAVRGRWKNTR